MRRSQSPQERNKRGRGRNSASGMACIACGSILDASSASCACGAQFCSYCASSFKADTTHVCPSCGQSGQSLFPSSSAPRKQRKPSTSSATQVAQASGSRGSARSNSRGRSPQTGHHRGFSGSSSSSSSSGSFSGGALPTGASAPPTQISAEELERRKKLVNIRVIQRRLVYVTNISVKFLEHCGEHPPHILRRREYFGQYGKIKKLVVNMNATYSINSPSGPTVGCYVTFAKESDAESCIAAVNGAWFHGKLLRASYGTTKYCTYFLRGATCTNSDCLYLHEIGQDADSFTKETMAAGKNLFSDTVVPRVCYDAKFENVLPPPGVVCPNRPIVYDDAVQILPPLSPILENYHEDVLALSYCQMPPLHPVQVPPSFVPRTMMVTPPTNPPGTHFMLVKSGTDEPNITYTIFLSATGEPPPPAVKPEVPVKIDGTSIESEVKDQSKAAEPIPSDSASSGPSALNGFGRLMMPSTLNPLGSVQTQATSSTEIDPTNSSVRPRLGPMNMFDLNDHSSLTQSGNQPFREQKALSPLLGSSLKPFDHTLSQPSLSSTSPNWLSSVSNDSAPPRLGQFGQPFGQLSPFSSQPDSNTQQQHQHPEQQSTSLSQLSLIGNKPQPNDMDSFFNAPDLQSSSLNVLHTMQPVSSAKSETSMPLFSSGSLGSLAALNNDILSDDDGGDKEPDSPNDSSSYAFEPWMNNQAMKGIESLLLDQSESVSPPVDPKTHGNASHSESQLQPSGAEIPKINSLIPDGMEVNQKPGVQQNPLFPSFSSGPVLNQFPPNGLPQPNWMNLQQQSTQQPLNSPPQSFSMGMPMPPMGMPFTGMPLSLQSGQQQHPPQQQQGMMMPMDFGPNQWMQPTLIPPQSQPATQNPPQQPQQQQQANDLFSNGTNGFIGSGLVQSAKITRDSSQTHFVDPSKVQAFTMSKPFVPRNIPGTQGSQTASVQSLNGDEAKPSNPAEEFPPLPVAQPSARSSKTENAWASGDAARVLASSKPAPAAVKKTMTKEEEEAQRKKRLAQEAQAKALLEEEQRLKAEREAKLKAEREAKKQAEKEARQKAERERRKAEEAKAKAEARERAEKERMEREARLKAEREAAAKAKAEREAKKRAEKEAKAKAKAKEKEEKERAEKEKAEKEAKAKALAKEKERLRKEKKAEEELKKKQQEEKKAKEEEQKRAQAERDKNKQEAEPDAPARRLTRAERKALKRKEKEEQEKQKQNTSDASSNTTTEGKGPQATQTEDNKAQPHEGDGSNHSGLPLEELVELRSLLQDIVSQRQTPVSVQQQKPLSIQQLSNLLSSWVDDGTDATRGSAAVAEALQHLLHTSQFQMNYGGDDLVSRAADGKDDLDIEREYLKSLINAQSLSVNGICEECGGVCFSNEPSLDLSLASSLFLNSDPNDPSRSFANGRTHTSIDIGFGHPVCPLRLGNDASFLSDVPTNLDQQTLDFMRGRSALDPFVPSRSSLLSGCRQQQRQHLHLALSCDCCMRPFNSVTYTTPVYVPHPLLRVVNHSNLSRTESIQKEIERLEKELTTAQLELEQIDAQINAQRISMSRNADAFYGHPSLFFSTSPMEDDSFTDSDDTDPNDSDTDSSDYMFGDNEDEDEDEEDDYDQAIEEMTQQASIPASVPAPKTVTSAQDKAKASSDNRTTKQAAKQPPKGKKGGSKRRTPVAVHAARKHRKR